MPKEFVEPCLSFWDDGVNSDDTNITRWAKETNTRIITMIPSIIQHLDGQSYFDPSRNLGGTDFFSSDPSGFNWDDDYYTPWTNVIRR